MNIDQMEYNLQFDPQNYDDEMEFRLTQGDINKEDLIDFLSEEYISPEQFVKYIQYLDYLGG